MEVLFGYAVVLGLIGLGMMLTAAGFQLSGSREVVQDRSRNVLVCLVVVCAVLLVASAWFAPWVARYVTSSVQWAVGGVQHASGALIGDVLSVVAGVGLTVSYWVVAFAWAARGRTVLHRVARKSVAVALFSVLCMVCANGFAG